MMMTTIATTISAEYALVHTICEQSTQYQYAARVRPSYSGYGLPPFGWVSATGGFLVTASSTQVDKTAETNLGINSYYTFVDAWNCSSFPCSRQHLICSKDYQPDCPAAARGTTPGTPGWDVPQGPFTGGDATQYLNNIANDIVAVSASATNFTVVYLPARAASSSSSNFDYFAYGVTNPSVGFSTDVANAEDISRDFVQPASTSVNQPQITRNQIQANVGGTSYLSVPALNTQYARYSSGYTTYSGTTGTYSLSSNGQAVVGTGRYTSFAFPYPPAASTQTSAYPSPVVVSLFALKQQLQANVHGIQTNQAGTTLCGSGTNTKWSVAPVIIVSSDDSHVGIVYGVYCNLEAGTVYWMAVGRPQFATTTTYVTSTSAYLAATTGADVRLWTEGNSLIPAASQFSFTSDGSCYAAGHPVGATSSQFQFGAATIYCFNGFIYSVAQSTFTVGGSTGFGTAVQFFNSDTQLAVSAPTTGAVYIFAFDPVAKALLSTTPVHTITGPAGVGFGTTLAPTANWIAVSAPSTTSCSSQPSNSGSVYVYANVTDCLLSNPIQNGSCNSTTPGSANGTAPAYYVILAQPQNGGAACPTDLTTTVNCTNAPVDCVQSDWTIVSACNVSCGDGYLNETRTTITPAQFGGAACGPLTRLAPCNLGACVNCSAPNATCPVDCVIASYTPITNCSAACGGGYQVFQANVATPAQYGGKCNMFYAGQCNTQSCIAPTVYLNCSFYCNTTNSTTVFNTTSAAFNVSAFNQSGCTLNCTQLQPVNCELGTPQWYQVQPCSKPCIPDHCQGYVDCLAGATVDVLNVTKEALYGGTPCPSDRSRLEQCGTFTCAKPDYFLNCSFSCNGSVPCNCTDGEFVFVPVNGTAAVFFNVSAPSNKTTDTPDAGDDVRASFAVVYLLAGCIVVMLLVVVVLLMRELWLKRRAARESRPSLEGIVALQ
jgi:hypothetical protein